MNTILVPVDFSIYSEHAIDVAFQIAKAKGVSVHLLHCVEKGESHQDTDTKLSDYTTQATALGIQVQSFIEEGSRAHKVITTHAHSHQADLIIMGSHGLTPGDSQFIGSNAQRVVRHAPCPVFTIKNRQDQFKIERIVYPSDFKYETDPMFNRVLDFANFFNAKIELVYVNTPSNFSDSQTIEKRIQSFLQKQPNTISTINIYNDFNNVDGILNFSNHITSDMIAMTTLGKTGLHRFLDHSITESIVNFSEKPVLTLCFSELNG